MIQLNFDITTGVARLAQTTTIKVGGPVPVRVVFSAAPGTVDGIQLALGTDAAPPAILAFTEDFAEENETTWTALLDANDSRLVEFMATKGATPVNVELACTLDGVEQIAPNVSITVQPRIITGDPNGESGPSYYTEGEVDTLLDAKAAKTVATKYRIKTDGTFQLWNADQSKWHTLIITGAVGAETLSIAAGEV